MGNVPTGGFRTRPYKETGADRSWLLRYGACLPRADGPSEPGQSQPDEVLCQAFFQESARLEDIFAEVEFGGLLALVADGVGAPLQRPPQCARRIGDPIMRCLAIIATISVNLPFTAIY